MRKRKVININDAIERIRILRAACVLLPLEDKTIDKWAREFDVILERLGFTPDPRHEAE